ncbi:nitroreductase family protein [Ancylobacter lacus]|uniref:nitroreductase family protein n=1 Tax=Ancylobacter lacus TaxID=2579970 RepID=UPI001BCD3ED8|nr:nitroreductase family protein [Ancylobacter lacus]MBS7537978.1 nitroreductase family protein [Ancylobacter lacus]
MLLDRLKWRYATKKMDPAKRVPEEKVDRILEAARLAPTSSGLQPFEIIVVKDPAVRAKILEVGYGQSQIVDASHLLVFAAWDNYTAERINEVYDRIAAERGGETEGLKAYRQRLLDGYPGRDPEANHQHAARQAYIAFGLAIAAAAFEEVDATPMEGFDPDGVDAILGLRERGLRSVTLLPLGYRKSGEDWLDGLKKVRRPREALVTTV